MSKKKINFLLTNQFKSIRIREIKKPLRKRSKLTDDITENCAWWKHGMELTAEWTFEGNPEL